MKKNRYDTDTRTTSQKMLDRATVLLNAAQAKVKREKELLNRKSTGPHNVAKRMRKVKEAVAKVEETLEAVNDFREQVLQEELEASRKASEGLPIETLPEIIELPVEPASV